MRHSLNAILPYYYGTCWWLLLCLAATRLATAVTIASLLRWNVIPLRYQSRYNYAMWLLGNLCALCWWDVVGISNKVIYLLNDSECIMCYHMPHMLHEHTGLWTKCPTFNDDIFMMTHGKFDENVWKILILATPPPPPHSTHPTPMCGHGKKEKVQSVPVNFMNWVG